MDYHPYYCATGQQCQAAACNNAIFCQVRVIRPALCWPCWPAHRNAWREAEPHNAQAAVLHLTYTFKASAPPAVNPLTGVIVLAGQGLQCVCVNRTQDNAVFPQEHPLVCRQKCHNMHGGLQPSNFGATPTPACEQSMCGTASVMLHVFMQRCCQMAVPSACIGYLSLPACIGTA